MNFVQFRPVYLSGNMPTSPDFSLLPLAVLTRPRRSKNFRRRLGFPPRLAPEERRTKMWNEQAQPKEENRCSAIESL